MISGSASLFNRMIILINSRWNATEIVLLQWGNLKKTHYMQLLNWCWILPSYWSWAIFLTRSVLLDALKNLSLKKDRKRAVRLLGYAWSMWVLCTSYKLCWHMDLYFLVSDGSLVMNLLTLSSVVVKISMIIASLPSASSKPYACYLDIHARSGIRLEQN